MLKSALFGVLLATPISALALDEISSIPESHQKLVRTIKEELGLKNSDKAIDKKIYGQLDHALKDGWFSY